jgi:hypothetical protein
MSIDVMHDIEHRRVAQGVLKLLSKPWAPDSYAEPLQGAS